MGISTTNLWPGPLRKDFFEPMLSLTLPLGLNLIIKGKEFPFVDLQVDLSHNLFLNMPKTTRDVGTVYDASTKD